MIAHRWQAEILSGGKKHSFCGVDILPLSGVPNDQPYPYMVLLDRVVRAAADKEFGAGKWSVSRTFDPYAWNASPASDYGCNG
jgi:hypothetical protein